MTQEKNLGALYMNTLAPTLHELYRQREINNNLLKEILDLAECKSGYKGPYVALSNIKELVLKYLGEV